MRYLSCSSLVVLVFVSALFFLPAGSASEETYVYSSGNVTAMCPCTTLTAKSVGLIIRNTANFTETYGLSLEFPDGGTWSGFILPEVSVDSQKQKFVDALYITPSCQVSPGTYSVRIIIKSRKGAKTYTKEVPIEISKCHWFEISAGDVQLCEGMEGTAKIVLANGGQNTERIALSSNAAWAGFSENDIALNKGDKKSIEIRFKPPANFTGLFNFTVVGESLNSYASTRKTLSVEVRRCYGTGFEIRPSYQEVCPCKSAAFSLTVRNTGILPDNYTVQFRDDSQSLYIEPGASEELNFSVNIPCDKEAGNYSTSLIVKSRSDAGGSVNIGVLPLKRCYSIDIQAVESRKTIAVGKSAVYTLTVTNDGKTDASLELIAESPEWVYVSAQKAELAAGTSQDIYVYAAPAYATRAGNYSIKVKAISENAEAIAELNAEVVSSGSDYPVSEPISLNISIPTGGVVAGGAAGKEGTWNQIVLVTVLAVAVLIVLILRFVIMIK